MPPRIDSRLPRWGLAAAGCLTGACCPSIRAPKATQAKAKSGVRGGRRVIARLARWGRVPFFSAATCEDVGQAVIALVTRVLVDRTLSLSHGNRSRPRLCIPARIIDSYLVVD